MTPPCPNFHASQLPLQIQSNAKGKKRKTVGGKDIDLKACELFNLMQYHCSIEHPQQRDSPVVCYPVQRWFRRCHDNKASFMVETTAWEGTTTTKSQPEAADAHASVNTSHWHDGNKINYFER